MARGKGNPRTANGNTRRKYRARFKAMNAECGICHGKLGPIRYDQPSKAMYPLSFVIDEIKPVSLYKVYGYDSPRAAAEDPNNVQAAHWICNALKGNGTRPKKITVPPFDKKYFEQDGAW